MFFQTISQILSDKTDLSINIKSVNGKLSVAVMPKHSNVKEDTGENLIPLVISGTPEELDNEFLKVIIKPVEKVCGILSNIADFEKQAEKVSSSQNKANKGSVEKETKEAREKREKMEKLLKKSEEAETAGRISDALVWLKQARALAQPEKQKEIDGKMKELQKQQQAGSLFGEQEDIQNINVIEEKKSNQQITTDPAKSQQTYEQMPNSGIQQSELYVQDGNAETQPHMAQMFPGQQFDGQPIMAHPKTPNRQNIPPQNYPPIPNGQYMGTFPPGYPQQPNQQYPYYGGNYYPQQPQPQNIYPNNSPTQNPSDNRREYHSQPNTTDTFNFDKDDENDREQLKENPYLEYLDCPPEYTMKNEEEIEMVCC